MAIHARRGPLEDAGLRRYMVICHGGGVNGCGARWPIETCCSPEQILAERREYACPGCRRKVRVRFARPSNCEKCGTALNGCYWHEVCGPCELAERLAAAPERPLTLSREERRVLWALRSGPATSHALMLRVRLGWIRVERALVTLERMEMARSEEDGGRRLWRAVF